MQHCLPYRQFSNDTPTTKIRRKLQRSRLEAKLQFFFEWGCPYEELGCHDRCQETAIPDDLAAPSVSEENKKGKMNAMSDSETGGAGGRARKLGKKGKKKAKR